MLVRRQQLDAHSQAIAGAFEERMVTMARERYPAKTRDLTEPELRAIIHAGVKRAEQYGIDLTGDVERFIRLMFRFPVCNFEEEPPTSWTSEVLTDETLTAEGKLDQVEGRACLSRLIDEEEN